MPGAEGAFRPVKSTVSAGTAWPLSACHALHFFFFFKHKLLSEMIAALCPYKHLISPNSLGSILAKAGGVE